MQQSPAHIEASAVRDMTKPVELTIDFEHVPRRHWFPGDPEVESQATYRLEMRLDGTHSAVLMNSSGGQLNGLPLIANEEPQNLLYPYTSKRKVTAFHEDVRLGVQTAVSGDLSNIVAKVDRVANPDHPNYPLY